MRRHALFLSLGLAFASPAFAGTTYISRDVVDLSRVLPAPPAVESDAQKRDLETVLAAQAARTPQQTAAAQEKNNLTVFQFKDVLGANFSQEKLPKTTVFFQGVLDDSVDILAPAKDKWKRPRPFVNNPDVKPAGEQPKSASYPSGNALLGYVYAIILTDIIPEKHDEIFAKGLQIGDARVIAGVHYPSDLAAGRLSAVAITETLRQSPKYKADFDAARTELRAALGL